MNKIQVSSQRGGASVQQKEACVEEVNEAYQAWGTAGLLLVECCALWANKIGKEEFLKFARKGKLLGPAESGRPEKVNHDEPFFSTRTRPLATV